MATKVSTVGDKTSGPTWWRYRYWLLFIVWFAYTIQYLDRVKTTTLIPLIMSSIGLSHADVGNGIFLMMIFYGPAQFVSGILCDKYGAKKVLIFSIIAWSILTAWMAFMNSATEWYIRSAIFGVCVGTEFVPSARLLARWFPPRQRAQAQSILSWAWIVTPAWAPLVATLLVALLGGWRPVFLVVALIGLIPFAMILWFVYDRPEQCKWVNEQELKESYEIELLTGFLTEDNIKYRKISDLKVKEAQVPFSKILHSPGFIPITIVDVASQMTLWGVLTWSATYLKEVFGFSLVAMGAWASVYFIGGALGAFGSSWISDTLLKTRRKPMIMLSFAGTIPFILILALVKPGISPYTLVFILAGAGFFANMSWGPFLSWPADVFSPEVYGKAMGFMQCFGYIGGAFAPLIMSRLIVSTQTGTSYVYAWLFIAICAFTGLTASAMVRDKVAA
ncbi:putative sulfoacetate transporter SauU [Moorella thermoacetica]|uniref:Sulfoacetate transporter SauU n=1 Tax=Neomoorella thermoacetica TaxID=1525 RepID=A0AAC9MW29_NEOTH|nr:MFS transporter [Moorella thermoacetica]AOQ25319.1 putative sulfoacetate transporter SauU [Moorella thermoacetica]TYL11880.1 putative sulfoacetate transporter SauU [Moorella thermoacetica]